MKCYRCLVAYQRREGEEVSKAEVVYNGQSLCAPHVNEVRGLPPDLDRYPEDGEPPLTHHDVVVKTYRHMRNDHDHIVFTGDIAVLHETEYPECTWTPS